jgi:hypothetical protein
VEPLLEGPGVLLTATAVLPHRVEQREIKEFARGPFAGKSWGLEWLLRNFNNGFIEARYFCQSLEWFGQEWSFPNVKQLKQFVTS